MMGKHTHKWANQEYLNGGTSMRNEMLVNQAYFMTGCEQMVLTHSNAVKTSVSQQQKENRRTEDGFALLFYTWVPN